MNTVTFEGKVMHLEGQLPVVGQPAPKFQVVGLDLSPVALADYSGKTLVLASVPSLDTPVCNIEARHFNNEAAKLSSDVAVLVISCDLPFAQVRWSAEAGAKSIVALSDYQARDFGLKYGVLIKELMLLARAVFVVDKKGILTYSQLVPEITAQPDFKPVLEAVKKAL